MSIGRNDLCPCGSGKKYKKCCLVKSYEQAEQEEAEWQEWFKKDCEEGDKLLQEYEAELQKRLEANT